MANDSSKSVIITGAGSGIGASTAKVFRERGWFVGLLDIDLESAESLAEELGSEHCFVAKVDVTDSQEVQSAIDLFCEKTNGRLDAFINNAGLFHDVEFMELDRGYAEKVMQVNMNGVVNCAYSAFPYLKQTADSYLVNICSAASITGAPRESIYCGTKFFVRGFSESIRPEWESEDITVNLIMPGYIDTRLYEQLDESSKPMVDRLMVSPEVAAQNIYRSATSKKMYRVFPFAFRALQTLVKIVPLNLVPVVLKRIVFKPLTS